MRNLSGRHLIIDGVSGDSRSLGKESLVALLDALVIELGMAYLHRPLVFEVPVDGLKLDSDEDEGGISAFCQITTSHISIHTWPLKSGFMMDIFSCKDFDVRAAKALVFELLCVTDAKVQDILREGP